MSDSVTMARAARGSLARGLGALQGDPGLPPHLVELASPIAQAMGALHQIERSGGVQLMPHAQTALTAVQTALAQLQAQPPAHPALVAATEAVAEALGNVHALARGGQQTAPVQVAQAAPAPQPAARAPAQPVAPQWSPPQQAASGPAAYAMTAPAPQVPAPVGQPAPGGDVPTVAAELGAFSPSNFYKGLSGNDIVDHGGLFVSTYKLPKLGSRVRLRVSMPGGYEFEANGLVRWRREANEASTDAPPGFGAQLTDITAEARQLVYRYVRNREPMFHDDL